MKKILFSAIILISIIILSSCNNIGSFSKHEHIWTEVFIESNCEGLKYRKTCSLCGEEEYFTKPMTSSSHDYIQLTDQQYHWYECKKCNEIKDKSEHTIVNDRCLTCNYNTLIQKIDGVKYEISSDGTYALVTGYEGDDTHIVISTYYNNLPVTTIKEEAFFGSSSIVNITIPEGIVSIENRAFVDCSSLVSISIPEGVKIISDHTFMGCTSLEDIIIPSSVTDIGVLAFFNCTSLTSITIPEGVTFVHQLAFLDCSSLENISVPNSIMSFDVDLSGSPNLKYNEYGNLYYIGNQENPYLVLCKAIAEDINSFNIHKDTEILMYNAFDGCYNIRSIYIPENVSFISSASFTFKDLKTSITSVEVSEKNKTYHSKDNCLIETATNTLIVGCKNSIIPDYVTALGEKSFEGVKFSSIIIPDNVTYIGDEAFYACTNLRSIVLPSKLTHIGKSAFLFCHNLTKIDIPDSLVTIDGYAFYECYSLEEVVITANSKLEKIAYSAFENCESLKSISIPNTIISVGSNSFYNCPALSFNEYGNSYYLGNESNPYVVLIYSKSDDIVSCEIHENTLVIGDCAFYNCALLKSITIPRNVISIGWLAFDGCDDMEIIFEDVEGWQCIEFYTGETIKISTEELTNSAILRSKYLNYWMKKN